MRSWMLYGSSIPVWSRMPSRLLTFDCTTQDSPTPAFIAYLTMRLGWWVMRQRRDCAAANPPWWAARFAIGQISGTAFWRFPRRAFWYWKTRIIRQAEEHLLE